MMRCVGRMRKRALECRKTQVIEDDTRNASESPILYTHRQSPIEMQLRGRGFHCRVFSDVLRHRTQPSIEYSRFLVCCEAIFTIDRTQESDHGVECCCTHALCLTGQFSLASTSLPSNKMISGFDLLSGQRHVTTTNMHHSARSQCLPASGLSRRRK